MPETFNETYGGAFEHAGHDIEVECETITGEAITHIRDAIRKNDYAQAEVLAVGASIQSLTRDGEAVIKRAPRSQRRSGDASQRQVAGLPADFDPVTGELLVDKLLQLVVSNVPWLATKQPFKDVFADYAPEDSVRPDPTPLRPVTQMED